MMKANSILLAMSLCMSTTVMAMDEYSTELVIVGSGTAGLTAAAYAESIGIDTIVLEKLATPGGQLYLIEGTYAVETPLQAKNMVGKTRAQSFKEAIEYTDWKANPRLVKRIVDTSADNLKWLEDAGVAFGTTLVTDTPDGNRVNHTYADHNPGKQAVDALSKVIFDNGGKILTETAGAELITNKKGDVVGIYADSEDEGRIKINADAVLMATGSIAQNKKLLMKYAPELMVDGEPMKSISLTSNTGDGVIMGEKVGAEMADLGLVIGESFVPRNTLYKEMYSSNTMLDAYMMMKAQSLWVNFKGERVFDESLSGDFTKVLNAFKNHGNQGIVIMDDAKRQDLMEGAGSDTNYFTMYDRGRKIVNFDKAIKNGEKRGYAFKANSIEELAKKMGIDVTTLTATVSRYNEQAQKGEDIDFGKKAHFDPLLTPPYYALWGHSTICDMSGGLKIDHNAQVIGKKGLPIKGLYAAGATAGGMYGGKYPYINPGFASATAIATGRFAVEHVKSELK
ncbi:FAD-binding protein [Ferrimonas sp. SCSIO 43195]|uniref:FAD-dependent oxidoreductase n=1 Tax=Ferrimonas sp. SCSIO 43195 TaxID=2822844 RepID=UPI0020760C77|nr:FAD-binding protein [Ferrimonas sp. SCSIO 43195]USD37539.1 FAD-binding protein [Ferrimonas sp. SCSIO 43195]